MVAETVAETALAIQESDRNDVFLRLIQQFEPALRRLATAYFDREADRADLFQEIALALWQAVPSFRREPSERTWLYRIAHNVTISCSAKMHRQTRREEFLSEEFEHSSAAAGAEEGLLFEEKRRALVDSMCHLAATDRQITLLHLEGLSDAEIEEVTAFQKRPFPLSCSLTGFNRS